MIKETLHEKLTRMSLPEEMRDLCMVTFSLQERLRLINKHLLTIFGERADWKKNLENYYTGLQNSENCKKVESLDDLREISFDDILKWIEDEKDYSSSTKHVFELISRIGLGNSPNEINAVYEAATILGLIDGEDSRVYSHFVNLKGLTDAERAEINNSLKSRIKLFLVIVRLLGQLLTDGLQVTYPVLGTIMTQQKQRNYYRGENAFYGSSRPSSFRTVQGQSRILMLRLNDLRRNEGCFFLDNFRSVVDWPYSSVNHIALVQHYGLKTQMMDITSDIMAALFFATCCFEDGRWRPLRANEVENADSRPHIYERGGDSRYAVLFRKSSEITDMEWALLENDKIYGFIFPVGFQPFMRCASQHAYGILAYDDNFDLYKDKKFEKYKIRLTAELCQWVFEQSDKGKKIYPNYDVPDISRYFEKINCTRYFSKKNFTNILRNSSRDERKRIQKELEKRGYFISRSDVSFITKKEIDQINQEYPLERAIMLTGLDPKVSPLIII